MEIEGIGGSASATSITGGALGKDEFLNLLVTQMRTQDPLDPMNSQETIAQLAQFSALEQMQNLNTQFEGFRKEDSLVRSLMLSGQPIQAELSDGTKIEGTIDRVLWDKTGMALEVAGETYPMKAIISLTTN